jgi:hypothetical protein
VGGFARLVPDFGNDAVEAGSDRVRRFPPVGCRGPKARSLVTRNVISRPPIDALRKALRACCLPPDASAIRLNGIYGTRAGSLRLEVGSLNYFSPFLCFVGNQLAEFLSIHRHWLETERDEARLGRIVGKGSADRLLSISTISTEVFLVCQCAASRLPRSGAQIRPWQGCGQQILTDSPWRRASARNLPCLIRPIVTDIGVNAICTCPASKSGTKLARYGTCTQSMAAIILSNSANTARTIR